MKTFRSFIPPLASMLMNATGGAPAQGVLIERSDIRFGWKQRRSNVEGRFRKWKANVDFRPKDLASSKAVVEIDLASVALSSEELEVEVRRPAWFDTARFPIAAFVSSSMRDLGGGRLEIAGSLSMKGVTKDAVVPIILTRDAAGNSVAEGQFTIRRLEFGVGDGMWAEGDTIPNDITIRVRMVLPSFQ